MTYNPEVLQSIFDRLSAGETVTMDDECMDQIPMALSDKGATHWFSHSRSLPNKERVGLRDKYVVTMVPFDPCAVEVSEEPGRWGKCRKCGTKILRVRGETGAKYCLSCWNSDCR